MDVNPILCISVYPFIYNARGFDKKNGCQDAIGRRRKIAARLFFMGTFGSFEALIGSFFGSTAACQPHGRTLLEDEIQPHLPSYCRPLRQQYDRIQPEMRLEIETDKRRCHRPSRAADTCFFFIFK